MTWQLSEFSPLFFVIGIDEKSVTKHVTSARNNERSKNLHGITIVEKFM